jgi:hypothetical protein
VEKTKTDDVVTRFWYTLKTWTPIAFKKTMQCEDIKGHELMMGEKISTNWANDMRFKC